MTEAGDQIIKILYKIENEQKLPRGILKEIYDEELVVVHKDIRRNLEKSLPPLITKYFEKE